MIIKWIGGGVTEAVARYKHWPFTLRSMSCMPFHTNPPVHTSSKYDCISSS